MTDGPYDVGYGKPPVHTRFQPGQSGNPKGRPKGSLNLATALTRALKERITVIEHGRRRSMTKFEAAVKGLVNRAVKGDNKAMQQMLGLAPLVEFEPAIDTPAVDVSDAAVMAVVMKRLGLEVEGDSKPKAVLRKRSKKSKSSSQTSVAAPCI